ncbi:MAG: zincin-like metallopeptidase domain-containing protein [Aeromonas sp.]
MEQMLSFHERVASQLIEQLKAGTAPWQKPWQAGAAHSFIPTNPTTGKRYKGVNALQLMAQGYSDPRWLTYKQAQAIGAHVRKGETGTVIKYWQQTKQQDELDAQGQPQRDAQGKKIKHTVCLERPQTFFATVFNAEQVDGLAPLTTLAPSPVAQWAAQARAEQILQASGAHIQHVPGDRACYQLASDSITLPDKAQFPSADNYYATALHELGHWSGHATRLQRDLAHPFGSQGYAKEELRAEISSMLVGDALGIGHDPAQHVAYVGSWIKLLQDHPLEIIRACADAEKIHDYVLAFELDLQPQLTPAPLRHDSVAVSQASVTPRAQSALDEALAQFSNTPTPIHSTTERSARIYLQVPFAQKEAAKELGAHWDRQQQAWYVPAGIDSAPFALWQTQSAPLGATTSVARHYLAVPYAQRAEAKAAGAKWDKAVKSWYCLAGEKNALLACWDPDKLVAQQVPALSVREEFAQAMRSAGLLAIGAHPIMDGNKHRVPVDSGKPGNQDGFYVGHLDGHPAGRIINNKTGIDLTWKSQGYCLPQAQRQKLQALAANRLVVRQQQLTQAQLAAAERITDQLKTLLPMTQATPYLQAKGVAPTLGVWTDTLGQTTYVPMIDAQGKPWAMQYIQADGTKRFAKESKKAGCFHPIGGLAAIAAAPVLLIAEGYATAATLAKALGFATIAAMDAGNLSAVAQALQAKYPSKPIVIAGDDDKAQEQLRGHNPGRDKAQQAALLVGGLAVWPIFAPGEQEAAPRWFSDFNDLAQHSVLGMPAVTRQLTTAMAWQQRQPAAIAPAIDPQQPQSTQVVRLRHTR